MSSASATDSLLLSESQPWTSWRPWDHGGYPGLPTSVWPMLGPIESIYGVVYQCFYLRDHTWSQRRRGGFLKDGYPQIIRIFHHRPSIMGYLHFRKPPHPPVVMDDHVLKCNLKPMVTWGSPILRNLHLYFVEAWSCFFVVLFKHILFVWGRKCRTWSDRNCTYMVQMGTFYGLLLHINSFNS